MKIFLSIFLCVTLLFSGCVLHKKSPTAGVQSTNSGSTSLFTPANRYGWGGHDEYMDTIQPLLAKRCVVCHACTSGPCQLNMTSYEGVLRGINKVNPYPLTSHVGSLQPTRLGDNLSTEEWRKRGFVSVLPQSKGENSVMAMAIQFGKRNTEKDSHFNTELVRELADQNNSGKYYCPANAQEYLELQKKFFYSGMPWGLPALTNDERNTLMNWLAEGAPGPSSEAQRIAKIPGSGHVAQLVAEKTIADWERYFNQGTLESALVSRYLYEHLWSANILFKEIPGEFYTLVRSRTAAPQEISELYAEMPTMKPEGYDGPIYYRLRKRTGVIEAKTHIVWHVGGEDLKQYYAMFFGNSWKISALPGYENINPFFYFSYIPVRSRAQFIRENWRMLIQGFARGDICVNHSASSIGADNFLMLFLKPDADPSVVEPKLGLSDYTSFYNRTTDFWEELKWSGDKWHESTYRRAFEDTLRRIRPKGLSLDDIWDGDGVNGNAWTFFLRHEMSAETFTGDVLPYAGMPQSVWLLSYANAERTFYNAAVHFRYWGSIKHKSDTYDWQALTRTEAEDLFISLFPDQSYRDFMRTEWSGRVGTWLLGLRTDYAKGRASAVGKDYSYESLLRAIMDKMSDKVVKRGPTLNNWPDNKTYALIGNGSNPTEHFEQGLRRAVSASNRFARYLPNLTYIRFGAQHDLYSLVANRVYTNEKNAMLERFTRIPQQDSLSVVKGLVGAYVNLFIDLNENNGDRFIQRLINVDSEEKWMDLADNFKVPRTSPRFWEFADWIHNWIAVNKPVEGAILDLRYYDYYDKKWF